MIIIGVDPGKTTGVATYNLETEEMVAMQITFEDFGDWLNASLFNLKDQEVVVGCENFIIRSIKFAQDAHWALENIGITRYLCHCYEKRFILQDPSNAKNFANDSKLRVAKWYLPGKGHANDAMRHVGLVMATLKIRPPWAA